MNLDRFLHFLISHNATVIEALFGITLLAVIFLAIRSFLLSKEPVGSGSSLDMASLEVTLKQILEKAGQVPAAGGNAGNSEEGQRLLVEITNLKTDLETKKKQIDDMKLAAANAPAPPAAGMSSEEKSSLDDKIRELQAKLSEYEIISEDIADLSFYKEQNAKLQKELEGFKGGGSAPVAAPVEAAPTPAPPPEPVMPKEEPAIVGKSSAASVEVEPPAPVAAEPVAAILETSNEIAIDDDLMAEFAAAVEKQKSPDAPVTAAAPAAENKADVDLGQMDMDKMLAEAAVIKTDGPEVDPAAALGAGLDESKLLQEAAALNSVSSEDKKLMGDFENFVKKGDS